MSQAFEKDGVGFDYRFHEVIGGAVRQPCCMAGGAIEIWVSREGELWKAGICRWVSKTKVWMRYKGHLPQVSPVERMEIS